MTDPPPTPYEVLGVGEGASAAEIRHAYLALARQFHPDRVDPSSAAAADAGHRMQAINQAWEVLGDPTRRRRLDDERPFRPFEADEPDPRLAPDIPYRVVPESPGRRAVTMAPVLLFAASVTVGSLGVGLGYGGLVAVAGVLFSLACVGFVAVPLLALGRASRDPG